MNSFFFANIRSFIGPFLLGLVSFAVLSTIFLNQLQFIFDIHDIKDAFIIFSFVYVVLPVIFIAIWLWNSNKQFKDIFSKYELIVGLTLLIVMSIAASFLIYYPNFLPTYSLLIGAGVYAVIVIGYSIYILLKKTDKKNSRSYRNEFVISYGLAVTVLFAFFSTNTKRLCDIEKNISKVSDDLIVYNIIKEFKSVAKTSTSILNLMKLQLEIDENDLGQLIHVSAEENISDSRLKTLFAKTESECNKISLRVSKDFKKDLIKKEVENISCPIDKKVDSLAKAERHFQDSLTNVEIHNLNVATDSIGSFDFSGVKDEDRYQAYNTYKKLDRRISNMAELYNVLHRKDWSNLINALKYKGLLFFSLILLVLLVLHFKVFMHNEEIKAAETIDYHSIENSGTGYKLTEKPSHTDLPELRILTSGISLIILLIIPALKPTKASQVNLDKPFISFGLAQFFNEENNDNRSYSPNNTYHIDKVINYQMQNDSVKLDIVDFEQKISKREIYLGPKIDVLTTNSKNALSDLKIINDNINNFANTLKPGVKAKGTPEYDTTLRNTYKVTNDQR